MTDSPVINDKAIQAFDKQSVIFDDIYAKNVIIDYKRQRTRAAVEKNVATGSKMLELNAGTGEDAVYFAQKGYRVHATDISEGMLQQLTQKINQFHLSDLITTQQISFTNLDKLDKTKSFDAIFSNFGGLNCTNQLDKVLDSLADLLKTDGIITLVIMPPFCLWEFLTLLKGNFKMAFRRFFAKKGAKAHIEGVHFLCWYYQPSFIIKHLKKDFELVSVEGLCTIVPPSYMESFPHKFPQSWEYLKKMENKLKSTFPFKYLGDYFIITLRKKN